MKRILLLLPLIACLSFGCKKAEKPADAASNDDGKLRIAINLPLSGPVASFSGEIPAALKLGLAAGAKQSGVSPDAVSVDVVDNQSDPKLALAGYEAQAARGFDVYVSGLSTCSVPLFKKLETDQHGELKHFLFAFEQGITAGHQSRLRLLPSYRQEGPALVAAALALKAKKVAIANIDIAATNEEMELLVEPGLMLAKVSLVRERFPIATADYKTLAAKLVATGADTYVISALAFNVRGLVSELKNRGVKPERIIAGMDAIDLLYEAKPDPVSEGLNIVVPPFELDNSQKRADWRAAMIAAGIKRPSYVQAYAYDLGILLSGGGARTDSDKNGYITGSLMLGADRDLELALRHAIVSNGKLKPF